MTKLLLTPLLMATSLASPGHAEEFRSTYSDTSNCPVTDEGDDAFIRECEGPGGVRAVLQYVEGLFAVFYLPDTDQRPIERKDMFEVSRNANQPYGAKLEWRQRRGEPRACAAIIRAYTTKGELLVVNNLANGQRVGIVKTNQQARQVADGACRKSKEMPSPVAATERSTLNGSNEVDMKSVENGARIGRERFAPIYVKTGISGIIEAIEQCYGEFDATPSTEKIAECAAMELAGAEADMAVLQSFPDLQQQFLSQEQILGRVHHALDKLPMEASARQDVADEILGKTSQKMTAAPAAPSGSVFDFSE